MKTSNVIFFSAILLSSISLLSMNNKTEAQRKWEKRDRSLRIAKNKEISLTKGNNKRKKRDKKRRRAAFRLVAAQQSY